MRDWDIPCVTYDPRISTAHRCRWPTAKQEVAEGLGFSADDALDESFEHVGSPPFHRNERWRVRTGGGIPNSREFSPSHGENRGSSPLGSANKFNELSESSGKNPVLVPNSCPISVGERWRTTAVVPAARLALSVNRRHLREGRARQSPISTDA
jgi:hypothetical protein